MDIIDQPIDQPLAEKPPKKKKKINLEKDSIQFNAQDLDQEQKVDVNPVQLNSQHLHVVLNKDIDYSSKITGTTYRERNKEIAANADIYLFWGNEQKLPICKTKSDNNGNFTIEALPSGYYTLVATLGENLKYNSHYIKVLPCQEVHESVLLKG